jgi:hypothetical protein
VGSPRSGTSILVDVISKLGYDGFREGNFLSLITTINQFIDRHYAAFGENNPNIMVDNVDPEILKSQLTQVFCRTADALNPHPLWFDKTGNPEMLLAIPTVQRFWPDAVFIFAKRRGLENIQSRIKKFSQFPFEYHCQDWARNMFSWRQVRPLISPDRYIEIDQREMIVDSGRCADNIIALLELDVSLKPQIVSVFSGGRAQETSAGSAERVADFATIEWTDKQKEVFLARCTDEMKQFGYALDGNYWQFGREPVARCA